MFTSPIFILYAKMFGLLVGIVHTPRILSAILGKVLVDSIEVWIFGIAWTIFISLQWLI